MTAQSRRSGFSMIELMIVIVIVGIGAAAAAPGISSALWDQRAASATVDVVRLGRRARLEAIASGRAQLLTYDSAGGPGRLRLHRGRNDGCNSQVWDLNRPPLDEVDMARYNASWGGAGARSITLSAPLDAQICYEPNGAMLLRASGGNVFGWSLVGVTSGVLFNIERTSGSSVGMTRVVVFPMGGAARVRQ